MQNRPGEQQGPLAQMGDLSYALPTCSGLVSARNGVCRAQGTPRACLGMTFSLTQCWSVFTVVTQSFFSGKVISKHQIR